MFNKISTIVAISLCITNTESMPTLEFTHFAPNPNYLHGTMHDIPGAVAPPAHTHQLGAHDHHGGVSIVGAGSSAQKGASIDFTKVTGPGHHGLFGGSFISSGKNDGVGSHHSGSGHPGGHYYDGSHHSGAALGGHFSEGAHGGHLSSYEAPPSIHTANSDHNVSPVLYSSFKDQQKPVSGSKFGSYHGSGYGHDLFVQHLSPGGQGAQHFNNQLSGHY